MVIPKPDLFWTLIFYPNVLFFALSYFDVKENYPHGRKSPIFFRRHTFFPEGKDSKGNDLKKEKERKYFFSPLQKKNLVIC